MARAGELTEQLRSDFGRRPAGSDAERRAAIWAARAIRTDPRRQAEIQTFWCRPNWAGAQAWHVLLAVVGSLLATTQPRVGAVVVFVALVCMLVDWFICRSPGRLLTRERASQNVVSLSARDPQVRLILTANLDTGRIDPDTRRAWLPGWLFWIVALTAWCLVVALVDIGAGKGHVILGVLQIIPTVGLIMACSWLLVGAQPSDNAEGVGAALGLARILDAAPPANLGVDLVLTGAGVGYGQGLRRHLRVNRRQMDVTNTVVLGIRGAVASAYLTGDGPLLPLIFFRPLRRLAADSGGFSAEAGRGCSPALPARMAHLPALSVAGEPDAIVTAGLELVDAIDAYVGGLADISQEAQMSRPRRPRSSALGTSRNRNPTRSDRRDRIVLRRPVPQLPRRKSKA